MLEDGGLLLGRRLLLRVELHLGWLLRLLHLVLGALRLRSLSELLLREVGVEGLGDLRVEERCVEVAGREALVGLGGGRIVVRVHGKMFY